MLERLMQTSSIGGVAETEVIELTVRPYCPFGPSVVTMLTPFTAWLIASVNASTPLGRPFLCRS